MKRTNDGALLDTNITKELFRTPQASQGLGFQIAGVEGNEQFSHGGVNEGFECYMIATALSGDGLVIMTNANGANSLIEEVSQAIRREYRW